MNTIESIRKYLADGVSGFNQLVADRAQAGVYGKHQQLEAFIVFGRWHLMTDGNFGLFAEEIPAEVDRRIGDVVVAREWSAKWPVYYMTTQMYGSLPRPTSVCKYCGKGWTCPTLHDHQRMDDDYVHVTCRDVNRVLETDEKFRAVFLDASIFWSSRVGTQNQYSTMTSGPWFIYDTPMLGRITVGWRRHVIHLGWDPTRSSPDFSKEDVTKDVDHIHAYGYLKLTEYLKELLWAKT